MSFSSRPRAGVVLSLALVLVSCGGDKVGPEGTVSFIEISPKTARLYTVGQQQVFTNTITTDAGTAGEGIAVSYLSRDPSLVQINSTGIATAQRKGGSTWIVVSAGGKSDSASIEVPTTTCGSVAATPMDVGQIITDVPATGFCVGASAGDYSVIVHNTSLAATGTVGIEISGSAIGTPPAGSGAATFSKAATAGRGLSRRLHRDVDFEMRVRRSEASLAGRLAATDKAWYDNRKNRATFLTTAPAINDQMSINVALGTANDCTAAPQLINARVAAISNSAIVLADPGNPAGGYSDAEYNEFAQMFDSIINPLEVTTFGTPSDIDGNGRVLLVFTKTLNSKTPAGSDSYVAGLTHSRDLLPKSTCAGSNEAEMFYLLVPDPTAPYAASNGNDFFSKAFVDLVVNGTIAHEFQHLINFSRRKYLNGTPQAFEEVWLNEGLSHIAQELQYYRMSGRTPRSNITGSEINTLEGFGPWYMYGFDDFYDYDAYALQPSVTSPFEAGDDLETRGATWAFLRYVVDQNFPSDGTFWYELVNSGDVGVANLKKRLGNMSDAAFQGMFRDFVISTHADDFVTSIGKYSQPSWNMRSMYSMVNQRFGVDWEFPSGIGLKDAQTKSQPIQSGGFQVYRFRGLSGTDSFIRVTGAAGSAMPPNVTITVIRTQ